MVTPKAPPYGGNPVSKPALNYANANTKPVYPRSAPKQAYNKGGGVLKQGRPNPGVPKNLKEYVCS